MTRPSFSMLSHAPFSYACKGAIFAGYLLCGMLSIGLGLSPITAQAGFEFAPSENDDEPNWQKDLGAPQDQQDSQASQNGANAGRYLPTPIDVESSFSNYAPHAGNAPHVGGFNTHTPYDLSQRHLPANSQGGIYGTPAPGYYQRTYQPTYPGGAPYAPQPGYQPSAYQQHPGAAYWNGQPQSQDRFPPQAYANQRQQYPQYPAYPQHPPKLVFSNIDGFGQDIPLSLALQQIIPSAFSVNFAPGVNPGLPITWEGGRPWNVIFEDILASMNVGARMEGTEIIIAPYIAANAPRNARFIIAQAPDFLYEQAQYGQYSYGNAPPSNQYQAGNNYSHGAFAPSHPGNIGISGQAVNFIPQGNIAPQRNFFDQDYTPPPNTTLIWTAAPGERVSDVLRNWAAQQNVQLLWNVPSDVTVDRTYHFQGTLQDASNNLLQAVQYLTQPYAGNQSRPAPQARLYPNLPDGPAILLVRG